MAKSTLTLKKMGDVFLFLLLISPIPVIGQFVLPFLYMPVKRLFPSDFGSALKYDKATSEHLRTLKGWSLEQTYSENMETISDETFIVVRRLTVADLTDLDYYWSYTVPFDEMNSSLSDSDFAKTRTPAEFQQELLAFISKKFVFSIDNVASNLGIPVANLSSSYDPSMWEAVVHAMVNDSSSAFFRLLDIPSVDSLAELVEAQDLSNANLSRFEHLVFPFLSKKAILDTNDTSYLINSSGIIPGEHYNDVTLAKILQQHVNLTLASKQFGILYNLTTDQAKAIGRATFFQIVRLCGITTEMILNITLPKLSWNVVGSLFITPPCPALIAIKGKSMASFQRDSVVSPQNTTVLEILTTVSNLTWRAVYQAVNASLPDWEFLDSVTLPQLAEVSGVALESLLNDSVSEAVKLVFRMGVAGTLVNRTEAHRAFIRSLLEKKFNLSLSEVANLIGIPEGSFQGATSPWLFRSFLNATITYFGLNLSQFVSSVHVSEVELYNLPRKEWTIVISAIIDSVLKAEAIDLQMSAENVLQFLGVQSVELSISQLKELMRNQILNLKQSKRKFEIDPISLYLSRESVTNADYLNSTVLASVISASGFNLEELKLVYGYDSQEIFILGSMRISDLPLYCGLLNTSAVKARTPYNITAELAGIKDAPAVCKSTRFYIAARYKNISILQEEFNPFKNASVSYVNLVEKVTGLPWRRNVWAFGLKMEDWTVLYVLSEDAYEQVTAGLNLDPYLSRTLLQIFKNSVQLQHENNTNLRMKKKQSRAPTLNILYELFSTNENELMHFGGINKTQYDGLFPIKVFPLAIHYLVGKFNVSVSTLEASLDLRPGNLRKLSPTEWPEMIPFVKAEVIRSGQHQLGVSLFNFAKLLENTPENLSRLTLAQLESKWDSVISRLIKGKAAIETESLLQIHSSMGITCDSLDDVTVLEFVAGRINVTKSEMLLLFNYNSIGIDVLGNYTFKELPGFCQLPKGYPCSKRPQQIIVSLLGHNNDMTCRKIASVAAAANITVDELADKFNFDVKDNVSLLTMFEEMFNLPWPKIAWAVNASLPDWPVLGAMTLSDIANLTSQTTANMKLQKSFREITVQLLNLPANLSTLLNPYRSKLVSEASDLFSVNSSKICDGCKLVNILWNSLTQLSQLVDFDPHMLPKERSVSPYEFNLTVPSQWSPIVAPIIREGYSRAAIDLGVDRDRLSTLLQTSTAAVQNMTLRRYQAVLSQSIKPLIVAKTALSNSPIADLIAAKGLNLSGIKNESVFDVIDAVLSVSIQNVSFIFNWTAEQQAKLKNYTLDDMAYYKEVGLQQLGSEKLLSLVEDILQQTLPPRTPPPPILPPCKRGSARVGNDAECTDVDECSSNRCGDDSLCQNYRGGFDCECNAPGHFKVNINGKCKPCKTFVGILDIKNEVYEPYLNNKSTENFFDFKEAFEATMNTAYRESSVRQHYFGCRVQNFRNGSVIVDYLIFTSPDFTGTIEDLQNAIIGMVNNNSYLGPYLVTTSEIAVEDFDECKAHQDNCGQNAKCLNKDGSFECECEDGYEGDGLTCEAEFFKTMWWTVIVAAFLLLIIVIIIVCLVIKRPKPSGRYGLDMDDSSQQNQPHRRYSEASKISYRSGDVYYKDREGKLRSGDLATTNDLGKGPHAPHFVAEDEFQPSNGVRAKTPFELAVERNKRSDEFYPSNSVRSKSQFELAVERNARNGNVYEQTQELNMTELPYASINA